VKALRLSLYAHAGSATMGTKKRVRSRVSYGPSRYFEASSMMYPSPHLQTHYAWISYPANLWQDTCFRFVFRMFKNHTTILTFCGDW
jgi:hypothetical protein